MRSHESFNHNELHVISLRVDLRGYFRARNEGSIDME